VPWQKKVGLRLNWKLKSWKGIWYEGISRQENTGRNVRDFSCQSRREQDWDREFSVLVQGEPFIYSIRGVLCINIMFAAPVPIPNPHPLLLEVMLWVVLLPYRLEHPSLRNCNIVSAF
jgi:hypothetical protein